MKTILNALFEHQSLSAAQSKEVLIKIASGDFNQSQVAAFMSVYLMRPITVEELSGFRDAMLELCDKVSFETADTIDIVGTGGDGKDTFNISTLSCFVAAAAGIKVTKHGNYGVSSISGSSNVLEALGYRFTNNEAILREQLDKTGLCFLHAPLFHPAMKSVANLRKELSVRTFFNMLGPLVNPSSPQSQLLGVYNLEMARLYNYLLQGTDQNYSIVHSLDGYDEVSLTSEFKLITRSVEKLIHPAELGYATLKQNELYGGATVEKAAQVFMDVLEGKGTMAQNNAVVINAAFAIQCVQSGKSIEDCIAEAEEALSSKKALHILKQLTAN